MRTRHATPARALLAATALLLPGCAWQRPGAEPEVKWFRYYAGPMRPEGEVAVLCTEGSAIELTAIRHLESDSSQPARHERWHFPRCLEALPGEYEISVSYFSRDTFHEKTTTITETAESTVPMSAEWEAEPGEVYVLRAVLGAMAPAPGIKPRAPREAARTVGRWYVRTWDVEIERVAWTDLDAPMRQHREAWRRYEGGR